MIPRSGFEARQVRRLDRRGTATITRRACYFSFGNHTKDQKFAWFASGSGNRTDRGLERVDIPVIHDKSSSGSAFTSLLYNPSAINQFRLVGAARQDRYQVPNTLGQEALGIRDEEKATDAFWNYDLGAHDRLGPARHGLAVLPLQSRPVHRRAQRSARHDDNRGSHYVGGYVNVSQTKGRHTYHYGTDTFAEHDDSLFGLRSNTGAKLSLTHEEVLWANVVSAFAEETFRVSSHFTLNAGIRAERFAGTVAEHAVSPRLGMAWQVGHGAVVRASYGRVLSASADVYGPRSAAAVRAAGRASATCRCPASATRWSNWALAFPVSGWTLDFDTFYNKTKNLVDHEVLGNSNLLFPLTIDNGRVRAFESTLKSPLHREDPAGALRVFTPVGAGAGQHDRRPDGLQAAAEQRLLLSRSRSACDVHAWA